MQLVGEPHIIWIGTDTKRLLGRLDIKALFFGADNYLKFSIGENYLEEDEGCKVKPE